MATQPLVFSVRAEGYGYLTIESLQIPNSPNSLLPPPLRQPVIDPNQNPSATQPGGGPIALSGQEVHSQPWNRWYLDVWRFITAGGGALQIFAPSVDETDIDWYGVSSVDAVTDPITIAPEFKGSSRKGTGGLDSRNQTFSTGDFIVWNDPPLAYEIDQIEQISSSSGGGATFTLRRRGAGAPSGQAQYGSLMSAHSQRPFYRLINKCFTVLINPKAGPQKLKLPWDNMMVAAVTIAIPGSPSVTVNLAQALADDAAANPNFMNRRVPAAPGLRTMNGAEYINLKLSGVLTANQTADNRVSVTSAWESIRCISGTVRTPVLGAALVVDVLYISPDFSQVGLIDEISISPQVLGKGGLQSYDAVGNPLDGRQMPFHVYPGGWPGPTDGGPDWPPEILPGVVAGAGYAITAGGVIITPYDVVADYRKRVVWQPGGYIDAIVKAADGNAADLTIANQT